MPLEAGSLYLMLFLRSQPGTWHWALYHHTTNEGQFGGGWKYHIINFNNGWLADHAFTSVALKTIFLIGLLRIAKNIPTEHNANIKSILEGVPHNVPNVTCRTWSLSGIQALNNAGYVRCNDPNDLEAEANMFASRHCGSADRALQPRPIEDCTICGL